jgi:hypothetical protein
MGKTYYLWGGIAAIEDLEDVTDRDTAMKVLADRPPGGDVTLWERDGYQAALIMIKLKDGSMYRFVR